MLKNTKVKLTKKWWKDNKAVTLVDKGHLEKVLEFHERVIGLVNGNDQCLELMKSSNNVLKNCDALDRAATINSAACIKKIHDETKFVLKGSFLAKVDEIRRLHRRRLAIHARTVTGISIDDLFSRQNLQVLFLLYSKSLEFRQRC